MAWEPVSNLPTVDSMLHRFDLMLLSLFVKHAPFKALKIGNNRSLPWVTNTVKHMIDLQQSM